MSISVGDNFSYLGAKPMDGRLKYDTLADMVGMADSTLYDGCMAYCVATDKNYQWKSTNESDATLGKWREFESGDNYSTGDTASADIADGDYFPFYDSSTSTKKKSLWSNIKSVLKTYFDSIYQATMSSGTGITITGNTINATNTLPLNYSTTEKVVGTWIDGKPLYQRTFNIDAPQVVTDKAIVTTFADISASVDFALIQNATLKSAGGACLQIPFGTGSVIKGSGDSQYVDSPVFVHVFNNQNSTESLRNKIRLSSQATNYNNADFYVTIQYTKTTD